MYLLKQLQLQGLGIKQLHIVFTALIVSRVLYALPACGGFLSSDLLNKIDSILRKAHKFGYTTEVLNVTDMLQNANNKLFCLCSDLVTAFIHYVPTSKWLTLSSATPEGVAESVSVSVCLTAAINCTNSRLSIDVFFATAIDMFCSVGHIWYLIWFDLLSFSPHNWMAFVRLNKRHVMLCYMLWDNMKWAKN